MTNRQEQELDAAEYVIGTLSVVERRAFEDLMASDEQTRQDVWYWERAFGALNVSISPEAPPANMWERIYYALPEVAGQQKTRTKKSATKKLVAKTAVVKKAKAQAKKEKKSAKEAAKAAKAAEAAKIAEAAKAEAAKIEQETKNRIEREAQNKAERKTEREPQKKAPNGAVTGATRPDPNKYVTHWWRKLAKIACVIALCLAAYTAFKPTEFVKVTAEGKTEGATKKQYFAVVNADWNLPSLVIRVDSMTGALKIYGAGIVSPKGRSLHIWHRSAKNGRKSIGLLGDDPENFRLVTANLGDVLEISIEPEGGAPSDKPSGPIVYSGKLAEFKP